MYLNSISEMKHMVYNEQSAAKAQGDVSPRASMRNFTIDQRQVEKNRHSRTINHLYSKSAARQEESNIDY